MRNWLIRLGLLILAAAPLLSQEMDLSGSWQVYQVSAMSLYSLKEYKSPAALVNADDMTLNADGTVAADLAYLNIDKWQMDEGFLLFETPNGNIFYYPRDLGANIFFLVRVDVLERNEEVISLTSKPLGNLFIMRK